MSHRRIGQLLSTLVPMSDQDVEEILEEQNLSRRPFGAIAVEWGLCQPSDVWQAWARQDDNPPMRVDLTKLGVDAQATSALRGALATQLGAIPIRSFENLLVIAIKDSDARSSIAEHFQPSGKQLAFVLADSAQIDSAIARYYAA